MTRRTRWLCVLPVAGLCAAAPPAPPAPQQFRARVDLARHDVTVLDTRTRQPIRGLRLEDFVLTVGGKEQPVVALAESELEARTPAGGDAASRGEGARDVTTNDPVRRLFVIVMDDAVTLRVLDPYYPETAKRVAHAVVNAMGPDDRAAVLFARNKWNAVDLTDDRAALHQAIDTYILLPSILGHALSATTIHGAQDFLRTMTDYRRAIVWVTVGFGIGKSQFLRSVGGVAAVPVYVYSTAGLQTIPQSMLIRGQSSTPDNDALRTFAHETGGEVYLDTNAPASHVPDMFAQLSSYYSLGFAHAAVKDGDWLNVTVRRPHTEVVPAGVAYRAPRDAERSLAPLGAPPTTTEAAPAPVRRTPVGLLEAIAAPLPVGDIPLRLSAVPLATGARDPTLVVTLGFTPPAQAAAGDAYRMQLLVFDGEGRKELHRQQQTLNAGRTEPGEILLRVPVRPGRYNIRVSIEHVPSGIAGSVFAPSVVVPDFAKAPLSLSGIALGRAESGLVGGRQAIAELLPFAPTAVRTFARTDHVGALVRVSQGSDRLLPVSLETTIVDELGNLIVTTPRLLDASALAAGAVEHRVELPLANLRPGVYLLRIAAVAGKHRQQREVRFTVE